MHTYALASTCTCAVYLVGGGLIIEANIPVQELEGQRGEGAYFRKDTVHSLEKIDNTYICRGMVLLKEWVYEGIMSPLPYEV